MPAHPTHNEHPALTLRGVTVRYDTAHPPALDDVDLSIPAGTRLALLGLNGSGKTTLLQVPVGLVKYQGEVWVDDLALGPAHLRTIRQRTGFLFAVPENQLLFPKVIDDVTYGLRQQGWERSAAQTAALASLEALGVQALAEHNPYHLSHGQRTRVALAAILATQPRLLLLDEPSGGLDPPGRQKLAAILSKCPATMIMATHSLTFARAACTHFALIHAGRIHEAIAPIAALDDHLFDRLPTQESL